MLPSDTTTALQDQYDTATGNFAQGYQDLMAKQNAEEASTYGNLQSQYDIPGLTKQIQGYKDQITGLQSKLATLPADVTARDKGTLTNQAMVNRQTTAEAAPIQTNLSLAGIAMTPLTESLTSANNNITTQMSLLADRQAREASGYTTANQATLNSLLDKLNAQRTLDKTALDQANALALQQASYQNSLALANATNASNAAIAKLMYGNGGGTTSAASNSGNLARVGNTNNVTVGGWSGSREAAADRIAGSQDRNSQSWQQAYSEILKEFPDIQQGNPAQAVSSFIPMPGSSLTVRKGF